MESGFRRELEYDGTAPCSVFKARDVAEIMQALITARMRGLSVIAHEAGHVSIHYLKNYSLPHGKLKNET